MDATALAHANIALVKYWGKIDTAANIPAVGSLSLTLSNLWTRTSVNFRRPLKEDRVFINEHRARPAVMKKVVHFLDEVRRRTETDRYCEVRSINSFPTAAGMASSASGFAALAVAAMHAAGHPLTPTDASALARIGSGSAARSIFGGFAELPGGDPANAPAAIQIADEHFWPLTVLVAITDDTPKPVSSRTAMEMTKLHSPFYAAWVDTAGRDLETMRAAVLRRDLETVGALAEHSALKMHGLMMSARPGLLYWNPGTVAVIQEVLNLRKEGLAVYFTIDAGPQVKVLCRRRDKATVADRLLALSGVRSLMLCRPGPSARVEEDV